MGYDSTFDQNNPLKPIKARYYMEAASAPTVNEDITSNFGVGCIWVNTATIPRDVYMCVNNADGAAVWVRVNHRPVVLGEIPLDADSVLHYPLVNACRILKLTASVNRATTTTAQAATIQAALGTVGGGFTNITTGLITIPGATPVATLVAVTPTAANEAAAGDSLRLTTTDGSQVAAATAIVTANIIEQAV